MSESPVEKAILDAKDALPDITPTPDSQQVPTSSAQALKDRLEWGEPALTIIDVRDRDAFNDERLMGAIAMPLEDLPQRALDSLEFRREIYVYGEDEEQATEAANKLREAGFMSVSRLLGGLSGWKAISGSTEGHANFPSRLN